WLVPGALERRALKALEHLSIWTEDSLQRRLRDDLYRAILVATGAHVHDSGVDRDRRIRDKRPRRSRPDDQLVPSPGGAVVALQGQAHVYRGILHLPVDVGLPELVARQRGLV